MFILSVYLQLNENLVKNEDIWKAKILEVEERYTFIHYFSFMMVFSIEYGMKVSCIRLNQRSAVAALMCVCHFK